MPIVFAVIILMICNLFCVPVKADDGVLEGSGWNLLFTEEMTASTGIVQSMCLTEFYIITIENVADDPNTPDVISAYYRFNIDENGHQVEQYSLAKRVWDEELEHGNSMCYNPSTKEIYVGLYTNTIESNRGCLYVLDPETLRKKDVIKVADDFNILAIAYNNYSDRYVIQTNADRNYSIMILDSEFTIIDDLGPQDPEPGYNFQDMTLIGDYLLQFPLTYNLGIGQFMKAYSLSGRCTANTVQIPLSEDANMKLEPETIAMLDDTGFIVAVNKTYGDGRRFCDFYRVEFPNLGLTQSADAQKAASSGTGLPGVLDNESDPNIEHGSTDFAGASSTEDKEKGGAPAAVIILIILLVLALAGYIYLQKIRQERARRDAMMRKRRREIIARIANERMEDDFELEKLDNYIEEVNDFKKENRLEDIDDFDDFDDLDEAEEEKDSFDILRYHHDLGERDDF